MWEAADEAVNVWSAQRTGGSNQGEHVARGSLGVEDGGAGLRENVRTRQAYVKLCMCTSRARGEGVLPQSSCLTLPPSPLAFHFFLFFFFTYCTRILITVGHTTCSMYILACCLFALEFKVHVGKYFNLLALISLLHLEHSLTQ